MKPVEAIRVVKLIVILGLFLLAPIIGARAQERLSKPIIEAVRASVVQVIATSDAIPRRSATGFRWRSPNLVITSYHVVAGADSVVVQSTSGGIDASIAVLVAVDVASDLALLRMERALPGAPLMHSSSIPSAGTRLWVVGYPLEVAGLRSRRLVMSDIAPNQLVDALDATARRDLKALDFPDLDQEVLHLEGDLLPGDSGAPILDEAGRVVAIGNGGLKQGQVGLGWGIPAARLDTLTQRGLPGTPINLAALQTIQTNFFSRVSPETIDETLWATASQLNTLEAYRDYLERFPAGTFAAMAQTRITDLERRYNRAIDYYRRALEYQAQLGIGGDVNIVRETHDRIEYNLKRAIAIYPGFEAAHLELGRSKYLMAGLVEDAEKLEAFKAAIDDFNNAIDLNPESAEVYLYRGFAYAGISDYRYACEDYVSFQRLKYTLSPSSFDRYRQQLRLSRGFLEYHGCDIPDDLEFVNFEDLRGQKDQSDVKRDCRPEWWVSEAKYCAKRGHIEAMARLASEILVLSGSVAHFSVEKTKELEKAIEYATILADLGDPIGQYYLGFMYWNGVGKPYVPERAFELMKSAMEGGYPEAFGSLGLAVRDGLVGTPDPDAARQIWARGAVKQDRYSISSLDSFDLTTSLYDQRQQMFKDFRTLLKKGTCEGYRFQVRGEMADRYEAACAASGPLALESEAIAGLAEIKKRAVEAVPLLENAYSHVDEYNKDRIVYALRSLRELTPEAVVLLRDIALTEKPKENADRINLDDVSRRRSLALQALTAAGPVAKLVVDDIAPLLKSADRHARLMALGVIGETNEPDLAFLIVPLANDPSIMVRLEAIRYINKFNALAD